MYLLSYRDAFRGEDRGALKVHRDRSVTALVDMRVSGSAVTVIAVVKGLLVALEENRVLVIKARTLPVRASVTYLDTERVSDSRGTSAEEKDQGDKGYNQNIVELFGFRSFIEVHSLIVTHMRLAV